MNKLDEFAMAALGGMLSNPSVNTSGSSLEYDLAEAAYIMAESMLKESNRRGQSELQNTLEKK